MIPVLGDDAGCTSGAPRLLVDTLPIPARARLEQLEAVASVRFCRLKPGAAAAAADTALSLGPGGPSICAGPTSSVRGLTRAILLAHAVYVLGRPRLAAAPPLADHPHIAAATADLDGLHVYPEETRLLGSQDPSLRRYLGVPVGAPAYRLLLHWLLADRLFSDAREEAIYEAVGRAGLGDACEQLSRIGRATAYDPRMLIAELRKTMSPEMAARVGFSRLDPTTHRIELQL